MTLTRIASDDAPNELLARAAAYDQYFELAQDWDLEAAETVHRAEKEPYQE
jgi:hypothetical protein